MNSPKTISGYEFLLRMIRRARTIEAPQKQALISRLESGEWTDDMRGKLLKLCSAEAAAARNEREQVSKMRAQQERFLADERERIAPDAERVLEQYEEDVQSIVDGFEAECVRV